jgi:hypothetical protein
MYPDFLNTTQASDYIRVRTGHRPSENTLKKLRCIGGGPEYRTWGRFIVYTTDALDAWITERLSGRKRSTSDDGQRCPGTPTNARAA